MQLPTLEPDQDWMINNLYCNENELWLVDKIKQGDQFQVVTDGSFHPEMKTGTSAWLINSSSDRRYYLLRDNLNPGASET